MSDPNSKAAPPATGTSVIEARALTKTYGGVNVVDAINFDILRGEVFGLLGPNGAGKTTTILMMLGLTEISSGTASVLGFNPARQPLQVKRRVGYLPDSVGFYDHLTATENLAYTAKLMGLQPAERASRIASALARVRLSDVADKRVATFSRGMRQRLGLAEIIVKRAEVAILDEPTSGLDPQATLEFLGLIEELKKEGVTVLLSSHALDQVQRICDRVALFQAGHIVLMGPVTDLARQVLGAGFVVEVEADGAGLARRLAAIAGVTNVETLAADRFRMTADRDVRPDAAYAVVAANGSLRRLSVDEPSLEAIYSRYFQNQTNQHGGKRDAA
jgi:ABC-2 type transport system ATP-binding protein